MKTLIVRFITDASGATAIEYSLIAGLISIAIILGATALGSRLGEMFQAVADSLM